MANVTQRVPVAAHCFELIDRLVEEIAKGDEDAATKAANELGEIIGRLWARSNGLAAVALERQDARPLVDHVLARTRLPGET